jgi:hypothetical protein
VPTLRVWIFTEEFSTQEYWKKNTVCVPGYGRVQVFQNNGTLYFFCKEQPKDSPPIHRNEVFPAMVIH